MPWTRQQIPSKKISPSPCAGKGDVGGSWPRESYVSLHGYEGSVGIDYSAGSAGSSGVGTADPAG